MNIGDTKQKILTLTKAASLNYLVKILWIENRRFCNNKIRNLRKNFIGDLFRDIVGCVI